MPPARCSGYVWCLLAAGLLVGLTCGCTAVQTRQAGPATASSSRIQTAHWPARARQALARAAATENTREAARWRLRAAAILLDAGQSGQAGILLAKLDGSRLKPSLSARLALLHARLALMQHRPGVALHYLDDLPGGLPQPLMARVMMARARAYAASGAWGRAVLERVRLGSRLAGEGAIANQDALWAELQHLSFQAVSQPPPPVPELRGWYALAYLVKADAGDPYQLRFDLGLWRDTYPRHSANRRILPSLLRALPQGVSSPPTAARVALLLPLSGPLAPAGRAVALGFHLARQGLEADEYDTRGDAPGAVSAYERALDDGADWVIGPLTRAGVEAVAEARGNNVTELALNTLPASMSRVFGGSHFYQFALGPGGDARAVSRRAIRDGRRRAAVLYVDTVWGRKTAADFTADFSGAEGTVVAASAFPNQGRQLGARVRAFLGVGTGQPLWQDVQGPAAEPRRQLIDMILLVADPRDARLIRPLLRFYHAEGLPVYATSQVFSGHLDRRQDIDLDGITFCDMPFLLYRKGAASALRAAAAEHTPAALHAAPRMVALGADAALLARHLSVLTPGAPPALQGMTGLLGLRQNGRIERDLPCARFSSGEPVPLGSRLPG